MKHKLMYTLKNDVDKLEVKINKRNDIDNKEDILNNCIDIINMDLNFSLSKDKI